MTDRGSITVSATISNNGDMAADEIVQMYIRDRVGSITRPIKELKGFRRIHLEPGEKSVVTFELKASDLAFFNGEKVVIEPGDFDLWIGRDSNNGLHGEFVIE